LDANQMVRAAPVDGDGVVGGNAAAATKSAAQAQAKNSAMGHREVRGLLSARAKAASGSGIDLGATAWTNSPPEKWPIKMKNGSSK
jgi:hypothetical protein